MKANIKRRVPESLNATASRPNRTRWSYHSPVTQRQYLVKFFDMQHMFNHYALVSGKTDDNAFHKVKDYIKENPEKFEMTYGWWFTTIGPESLEYKNYLDEAIKLN